MKISVDNEVILELSEIDKRIICDYLSSEIFDSDIKRRLIWIIDEVKKAAANNLRCNWAHVLEKRVDFIPSNVYEFCSLVFSQSDYEDKKTRDNKIKKQREEYFRSK